MSRSRNQEPSDTLQDILFLHERAVEERSMKEPGRREYVISELRKRGYEPVWDAGAKAVRFTHRGNTITVWPYKGFFSGKGVKDGRGIRKLLNQLDR